MGQGGNPDQSRLRPELSNTLRLLYDAQRRRCPARSKRREAASCCCASATSNLLDSSSVIVEIIVFGLHGEGDVNLKERLSYWIGFFDKP